MARVNGPLGFHVLTLALPGGIERMFGKQASHIAASKGDPDPEMMDEIGERFRAVTLDPPSARPLL